MESQELSKSGTLKWHWLEPARAAFTFTTKVIVGMPSAEFRRHVRYLPILCNCFLKVVLTYWLNFSDQALSIFLILMWRCFVTFEIFLLSAADFDDTSLHLYPFFLFFLRNLLLYPWSVIMYNYSIKIAYVVHWKRV